MFRVLIFLIKEIPRAGRPVASVTSVQDVTDRPRNEVFVDVLVVVLIAVVVVVVVVFVVVTVVTVVGVTGVLIPRKFQTIPAKLSKHFHHREV